MWTYRKFIVQLEKVTHNTAVCVIRGRNCLLPSLGSIFSIGGVECDSWDMNSFKTTNLARQFLRRNRSPGRFQRTAIRAGMSYPFMLPGTLGENRQLKWGFPDGHN